MNVDCNPSPRLGLFQTASELARRRQVFWMRLYALGAFVQRGWLRRNRGLSPIIFGLAVLTALASGVASGQQPRDAVDLGPHTEGKFFPLPPVCAQTHTTLGNAGHVRD